MGSPPAAAATARLAIAARRPSTVRRLDLQQDDRVDDEEDGEEDRPPVEVALDQRAAAERAAAALKRGRGKRHRVAEHTLLTGSFAVPEYR